MRHLKQIIEEGRTSTATELLTLFDHLEPADLDFMRGTWRGEEFITGHFLEGTLAASGWYGKVFASPEEVHPLLYYTSPKRNNTFALNPALAIFKPWFLNLAKSKIAPLIVLLVRPLAATKKYKARLRMTEYRGKLSATMIYDQHPINDVFRKVDERTLLGLMDMRQMDTPYFFILRKVD
jgi:hypothetical protein